MISSFLLQGIPRHTDTRLFEVREAFKRCYFGFQAHIRAYIAYFSPPALRGPLRRACAPAAATRLASPVALRATDETLINALLLTVHPSCVSQLTHVHT